MNDCVESSDSMESRSFARESPPGEITEKTREDAENARDSFTAAGSPTVGAVSEAVGFKVQAKEIATVWQQYHDKVAADKAAE